MLVLDECRLTMPMEGHWDNCLQLLTMTISVDADYAEGSDVAKRTKRECHSRHSFLHGQCWVLQLLLRTDCPRSAGSRNLASHCMVDNT